ncbi:D-alanyl-D-alanine carboxypeptidase precursor [Gammaproteobacteria bacterium MOLA455]|nr:D-alanyl-D-alanine carboxypeptidase precursor [Gammaproteobacteria bacterium MOLA455]
MSQRCHERTLNRLIHDAIQSGSPGLSVAIANKEGVLWTGVAGLADLGKGSAVQTDHLFGIGSITKTFVAVVILQLAAEGRLSLQATAMDILGTDAIAAVPNAAQATLAQLLNHTAGVPSWEDDPLWIREGRGAQQDVARCWSPAATLRYIEQTPPTNAPGEQYAYANTHYTLLGLVIEKVCASDLVAEIHQRILSPLQVSDIYLEGFQALPTARLAKRYHYSSADFIRDAGIHRSFPEVSKGLVDVSASNLSVEWAAGGMVATASALARFSVGLHTGKLLDPTSMGLMQRWFPVIDRVHAGCGLFQVETKQGRKLLGHTGGVLGYSASMQWSEADQLALVVLSNVGSMHSGAGVPNATGIATCDEFINAAREYAAQSQGIASAQS